ncbi:MAG: sulfide/dihydroorotate dehydrogenase-like FAD/NAD-binding protein [Clostridia bacterium]|nr:sulfide/dihydroorotate dehydrogenase-like FAD/NAD-binding protein [Clostridia bacterium]
MYTLTKRIQLNENTVLISVKAPLVAARCLPGQFVVLMVHEKGERIPLTVADYDREQGTVSMIFQSVGGSTRLLAQKKCGEDLFAVVGPLGKPSDLQGIQKAAVIGGGLGCAIAYPVARALHEQGCETELIAGFRSREQVILLEEMAAVSKHLTLMTDDGSMGEKGFVTDALRRLLEQGERFDAVYAVGPLPMMKFVCRLTESYGIPTVVSMNSIMIDGTGMCGCCRLTVGGKIRFACVDGPEFDGHAVDFDEAIARNTAYRAQEREADCRLLRKAEEHE